jgi:beta-galactosidase
VRAWYGQIGQQLQGLLWKDGGPVIGIQLENEYSKRGPGAGAAHILELKKLAMNSGLDAPLWLVTGWDDAVVPPRAVLPVYGGYADAPWDRSLAKQPPSEVYAFRFGNRISGNMDAIADATAAIRSSQADDLPFLTAEIGGGIEDTYHRRPVILPDDTAAMFPVMLGSGVNLYGTYMFQGGENPEGKHTPLEESQATGYPNDLPVRSYDFQAPLGEFGQERASFRKLKVFQYFLNGFGDVLAPMAVHAPDKVPENPSDFTVLRASVRSRGNSGFIFVNNHVRGYSLPARPQTQFEIAVPGGILHVPRRPMDIPSGAYFIWPFNLQVGGITLRYSTAELFTLLEDHGETTLVFDAIPGIEPEFALDAATAQVIGAATGELQTDGGVTYISAIQPGEHASIELRSREGKTLRLLVLSSQQAEDAWKIHAADGDHLLITTQDFFSDQKGGLEQVYLHSRGSAQFAFSILPSLPQPITSTLPLHEHSEGMFSAQAPPRDEDPQVAPVREADDPPPVRIGPGPHGVPEVPTEDAFRQAAGWSITVPAHALDGLSNLFLEIGYEGDIARLSRGDKLLVDNFYNGEPWTVGLKRFLDPALANRFMLQVLPLRADSPVYFDAGKRPAIPAGGRIDQLQGIRLTPEYQLTLTVR